MFTENDLLPNPNIKSQSLKAYIVTNFCHQLISYDAVGFSCDYAHH